MTSCSRSSLHSLHQPARLAGWVHPKTGKPSKLLNVDGTWYSPEALLAACTSRHEAAAVEEKPDQSVGIWREAEPGDDVKEGHYPTPEQLKVAVPLRLAISSAAGSIVHGGCVPLSGAISTAAASSSPSSRSSSATRSWAAFSQAAVPRCEHALREHTPPDRILHHTMQLPQTKLR